MPLLILESNPFELLAMVLKNALQNLLHTAYALWATNAWYGLVKRF